MGTTLDARWPEIDVAVRVQGATALLVLARA
jgi:hypothetical protein